MKHAIGHPLWCDRHDSVDDDDQVVIHVGGTVAYELTAELGRTETLVVQLERLDRAEVPLGAPLIVMDGWLLTAEDARRLATTLGILAKLAEDTPR